MTVTERSQLLEFLETLGQEDWLQALDAHASAMHEVDRDATRIWFAFWPLELHESLSGKDPEEMARVMDLEGDWKLAEQIDDSVAFLYGARHWAEVKKAVLADASSHDSLTDTVRGIGESVASDSGAELSLTLGISAVGLMTLRLVGREALAAVADRPASGELLSGSPASVVAARKRVSRDGLFTSLKGVNRRWNVRWDERRRDGVFRAINTQDLAMAGADAKGDYRELDYRRIDGPIPVECRVGSCGYCWIGVLGGRDKLSEISAFERERLHYFGYDAVNAEGDAHPPIRLACQAQCGGDVTLTIAPWNGELNRRHDTARDKLGTA